MQRRLLHSIPVALALLGAFVLFTLFVMGSSGEVITVDLSGGGDHLTIQEAVDAAQPGDTIQVNAGTYEESVLVDKDLTITGSGPPTIVDGEGTGVPFRLHSDGISLSGFTIQNGQPSGIDVRASEVLIEDCIISWCGDGIQFSSDSETSPLAYVTNTTYGGSSDDIFAHAAPTEDGGYILLATTESFGGSDRDYWLVKVDRNGIVEWDRVIDTTSDDTAYHVLPTTDGGYLISGRTDRNSNDFYIVKTNATGEVEWDEDFGGGSYDRPYGGSVELEDGSFVVVGYTIPGGKTYGDAYLIKIDKDGNEVWDKNYGGNPVDTLWDIVLLPDRGYLTTGYTASWGAGGEDVYVIRTDEDGERLWENYYGGPGKDRGQKILVEEERYLVVGYYGTESKGLDAWLMVVDMDGDLTQERLFGGSGEESFRNIVKTEDGGYLLSGYTYSYGNGDADSWLVKLDSDLNEEWNVTFGGPAYESASVMPPVEDTITFFSRTASFGNGGNDIWMLSYREILDNITIRDCTLSSNNDNGIYAPLASNLMIQDCSIRNNGESGIILRDIRGASIVNNSLSDNMEHGLMVRDADLCTITLNTVQRNKLSGCFILEGSWLNTITYNNFSLNEVGISVQGSSSQNKIHQNHIEGNVIYGVNAANNEDVVVDATRNWWGSPLGPHHGSLNPDADGDTISNDVLINPWLTRPTVYFSPEITQHGIVPEVQLLGEEVKFTAHGTVFGAIAGYAWRSDIDGEFYNGTRSYYNISSLSHGHHTIYCKVLDYLGQWSPEFEDSLVMHTPPTVRINDSIEKEITEGDSIHFFCNATDDGEVVRYVWSSSEDGELYDGPEPGFTISNLSQGDHNITVRVLDNYGVWSEKDVMVLKVKEKRLFIYDEIGPFPIIYYMALVSVVSLLVIVLVIASKKRQLRKQESPTQQQWPTIQTQQQPPAPGHYPSPPPSPQASNPGQPSQPSYPGQSPQTSYPGQPSQPSYPGQSSQASYPGQSPPASYPGQSSQPSYPGQSSQASYPGQPSQASYPGQDTQAPRTGQPPQGAIPPPSPIQSPQYQQQGQYPPQQFIISCPGCGKTANAAWTTCLKCGTSLK